MKRLSLSGAAICSGLLTAAALAQDVTGTWSGILMSEPVEIPLVLELVADGETLTGTVGVGGATGGTPPTEITEGRIDGNRLSWKLPFSMGGGAPSTVVEYEATLNADGVLEIRSTVPAMLGAEPLVTEFTARRAE